MELEHSGRRYALSGGEVVVGSDPAAGIVLADLLPRHAVVRPLGGRMATIRPGAPAADIQVNGVGVGQEPMPLLDGDVVRLGRHELRVLTPSHPAGAPDAPPAGARQQLHDTLFGVPRREALPPRSPDAGTPELPPAPPSALGGGGRAWIVAAALVSGALLLFLLLR